jgi:hypothetical protein
LNGLQNNHFIVTVVGLQCLFTLTCNGLGIAEVGAFENRQFKYSKKADRRTLVELLPSAPILAIPCVCFA